MSDLSFSVARPVLGTLLSGRQPWLPAGSVGSGSPSSCGGSGLVTWAPPPPKAAGEAFWDTPSPGPPPAPRATSNYSVACKCVHLAVTARSPLLLGEPGPWRHFGHRHWDTSLSPAIRCLDVAGRGHDEVVKRARPGHGHRGLSGHRRAPGPDCTHRQGMRRARAWGAQTLFSHGGEPLTAGKQNANRLTSSGKVTQMASVWVCAKDLNRGR